MNEELQSMNDELQAINDALRERTVELDEVNDFLESILTSIRSGVVVVDLEMRVLAWNRGAEDLWGLRQEEAIGQHVLNLDIGLPASELRPTVRAALKDVNFEETKLMQAVNRRGRQISLRLHCGPLQTRAGKIQGSILLMETEDVD